MSEDIEMEKDNLDDAKDDLSDSNSSETDSDDDDDDDQTKYAKQFIKLLAKIDTNRYDYDSYVELVNVSFLMLDIEKIRQAYDIFASVYPVAPDLWLRLIEYELNISTSNEDLHIVNRTFKRALNDYFSVDIAVAYTKLISKSIDFDDIWTELISTYALDCLRGGEIFKAWRNYFMKTLEENNIQKMYDMFAKELALPLFNMEDTYIDFKLFCEKYKGVITINMEDIDKKYNKAKILLSLMLPYENQLLSLNPKHHLDRAKIYKEYIEDIKEELDENIIQILYERMVTECCLNPNVWIDYIKYIQSRSKSSETIQLNDSKVFNQTDWDIVNRSLKNCVLSVDLYIEKMRIAEQMELSKKEIQELTEYALSMVFLEPEPIVTIWLEYLSYLRRITDFLNEKEVDILRATFHIAWTSLGRDWSVLADCNCEILQLWGRLEYGPMDNMVKGKELWNTVMTSSDNNTKSGLWIEFAHLELKKGPEGTRKIYRKAMKQLDLDNPYVIASAWLRFERANGTLEQIKQCQDYCNDAIYDLQKYLQKKYNNYNNNNNKQQQKPLASKKKFNSKNTAADDKDREDKQHKKNKLKRTHNADENNDEVVMKKGRMIENQQKDHHKIQEKTIKENLAQEEQNETINVINPENDKITIFVSNLDYNITEEEIIKSFPELTIKKVDLIKTVNGRGRGFGYVELPNEEQVKLALKLDHRMINNRPTYISLCERNKEQRSNNKFKYPINTIEKNKLFVKNLPYDIQKDDLINLFNKYGQINDVRIVYHKNGKSKGIAYVDYIDENSCKLAILNLDQYNLNGFLMNVELSAPPPRKVNEKFSPIMSLGSGVIKRSLNRNDIKPRISFIPRAVQKNVLNLAKNNTDVDLPGTSK